MILLRSFFLCLLMSSSCFAQLEIIVSQATAIESTTTVETKTTMTVSKIVGADGQLIGKERQVPGEAKTNSKTTPVKRAVAFIRVEPDLPMSDVNLRVICETAELEQVTKSTFILSQPGSHTVEAICVHADSDDWQFKKIEVTVGESPSPVPDEPDKPDEPEPKPPKPDFPDDGPFAGLAAMAHEKSRGYPNRLKLAAILEETAMKMQTFAIRSTTDATAYINANRPTCDQTFCPWFYQDSVARAPLSWQQTIDYYRTVAMGLKR